MFAFGELHLRQRFIKSPSCYPPLTENDSKNWLIIAHVTVVVVF